MPTATPADSQTLVRNAIKSVTALATLPEITTQIISVVEDPRSSAGKLHKIIAHDPSLAARMLKVVNSSFYGLPGQIGSVERAIVLLGANAVKNIAVAASLGQIFRGVRLGEGFTARDLWLHCVAVGVTARELARTLKLPLVEEAFFAGLVHDVGILVELQTWPEQLRSICAAAKAGGGDFCSMERQALGVDHQLLGKALAEQWKFTAPCQQVAGNHHQPGEAEVDTRALVSLVYVADTLCCKLAKGFNLTAIGQELDPAVLASAGIDDSAIAQVSAALPDNVAGAVSVFA